ncbi:hypothetical protein PBY51_015493 [Eleginops maclovinus]|uniref:Ferroptosis suppressor protein 1 n=1 Tax=Eleginops maclovinus TaxID=56733 RepID=A0AAN7X4J3_ELEMC|nr:hypothetical protein PBY51_015493 [Eleginops maclovinus]
MGGWLSSYAPSVGGDSSVHVVVVGGGFAGITAARLLQDAGVSFTLLDLREAFHHNVGALRASVQPGFAVRTFIPFSKTFGDSFVQGQVQRVDRETQTVILEGGREFQYSHLILCTGMVGPFPGRFLTEASRQSGVRAYEDLLEQVQAADSVLVVGGGSTGVEMAAEIKSQYPKKRLADPGLMPSVRQQAKQVLLEKGVELLLGQKVSNLSELQLNVVCKNSEVQTDKGQTLTPDLIISCTGLKVNSDAYASGFFGSLADGGALKVNAHLQVEGFSNVFALGDCTNIKEPKTGYNAMLHAAVAVSNITNSLSGKELTRYQTGSVTMLLAMGPDDGVGQLNGWKLPRFLVAFGKSRDLLVWKSWSDMKQKQP